MSRYVDLSEKVTVTYYDEQYEEWDHHTVTVEDVLNEVCDDYTVMSSAEPEVREIGYVECANAMLKMWIDNVLTDGEYNRIMDKLNEHWGKVNA